MNKRLGKKRIILWVDEEEIISLISSLSAKLDINSLMQKIWQRGDFIKG